MRLRHCFTVSMAVLLGLASPLCALACSLDVSAVPTLSEVRVDSQEHSCHDSGTAPEGDTPIESCEERCMGLELAAAGERVWERSNLLIALLPTPRLASSPAQAPVRSFRDRALPEPPGRPGILLLKSTLLI